MLNILVAVLLLNGITLANSAKVHPWTLHPFTTDNCTVIPDGTSEEPTKWQHCCYNHDIAYWAGGSFSERREADLEFKKCLEDVGESTMAFFAYIGLRASGTALLPTPFRWGYGWSGVRGYWSLNDDEKAEVLKLTPAKRTVSSH